MEPTAMLTILLVTGMCVVVPLAAIGGILWFVMRRARARHDERMAMIAQGIAPPNGAAHSPPQPPQDAAVADAAASAPPPLAAPASDTLPWAIGLTVGGVLWLVSDVFDFTLIGIFLTAVGAGYVTRAVIGMRRERSTGGNP